MTLPLKPDSYVVSAGGVPGNNDWYDYIRALHDHISQNSRKWSVDNHTDNGTDIGITLSPNAANANFQVNYRNDPVNLEMLMSVDPDAGITDPLLPTNSSSASPETPKAGNPDPASKNYHPHILIVEWVDAIGFMTVSQENDHIEEWHFGGRVYEPYIANQPDRGFAGLAWYGGVPRAMNGGWGRDDVGNTANKGRIGGEWVAFNSSNMDANDTYTQFSEQQIPSTFDLEVGGGGASRFGFTKYAYEIPNQEGADGWKVIDMPQESGLLVVNHDPSSGGRTLSVPWDVGTSPAILEDRYKGLTAGQQEDMLLALREDTLVQGGGGYPARQSDIGVPGDGQATKIWTDATNNRAFFSADSDSPAYTADTNGASGLRLDEASSEALRLVESNNLANPSKSIFEHFQTGSFTLAIRLQSIAISDGEGDEFFGTGYGNGSDIGLEVGIAQISGTTFVNADLSDGSGTDIWKCEQSNSTAITPSSSGYDELIVEQDASGLTNIVSIRWNEVEVFRASGFNLMSPGTLPDGPVLIGSDTFSAYADIVIQGIAIRPEPGYGPSLLNWIDGGDLIL